jgi:hypothetical protein
MNMNCNEEAFRRLNLAAQAALTRRTFLQKAGAGLGLAALGSLLGPALSGHAADAVKPFLNGRARAKRIIFLHQSGAPSHVDLFDHKPLLQKMQGEDLPASVRGTQRLTGMTSGYGRLPLFPSPFQFAQHGQSRAWMSELWPHLSKRADDLCFVKSLHTDAINHDPAITFAQTGSQIAGRPSFGAWIAYGLGSENKELPAFVVLTSNGTGRPDGQPLYDRLWSAGFLPSEYQGVRFRGQGDPVLFLSDPDGVPRADRREVIDAVRELNQDQPCAALIGDLKQRGLLEDTLVVWAGEFGRTVYAQGDIDSPRTGRDHHPKCFTVWMAGGGTKAGSTHGETDDFGYNIARDPVSFYDFNATLLHLLGVDHTRLTFKYQGRQFRLTDVHGDVVKGILA